MSSESTERNRELLQRPRTNATGDSTLVSDSTYPRRARRVDDTRLEMPHPTTNKISGKTHMADSREEEERGRRGGVGNSSQEARAAAF